MPQTGKSSPRPSLWLFAHPCVSPCLAIPLLHRAPRGSFEKCHSNHITPSTRPSISCLMPYKLNFLLKLPRLCSASLCALLLPLFLSNNTQTAWPLCCSSNIPSSHLPQDLCTCGYICLERYSHSLFFVIIHHLSLTSPLLP